MWCLLNVGNYLPKYTTSYLFFISLRRCHLYEQYTFSARPVIHKYTYTLKLFQWNRLIACVGFGCVARSPGGRKPSFFLWLFGTFLASPVCVLQSLLCLAAARHFFRTEQFGCIHPHFFPSIPQLSSGPSSSETPFQNSFSDSVVDRPYYRLSPLLSFHMHAERKSLILTWQVWKFGRMFVPANPHCRHNAVTHRRSAVLARGKMKILSPIYPTIQWPKTSGDMWERDFAITHTHTQK